MTRLALIRHSAHLLLALVFLALAAASAMADVREVALPDGRSYIVALPARADGAPMILALHGGGGNPDQLARNSGLSRPANAAGYAVVYPAGSGRGRLLTWNAGNCCAYAARAGIDDVAFLDAVVADAARRFGLDTHRVYLTGMSNGSMMAERYAALRPERVRAVAGVAGTMDVSTPIRGTVPLLHIHGTADASVPYTGGVGEGVARVRFDAVPDLVAAWRRATRATGAVDRRVIPPPPVGLRTVVDDWRDGRGRVVVRLVTIEGGGHVWPGGRRSARGNEPPSISANDEILRFFALHP
jgi:polyhydroxybutyrate depolymerase